LEASSWAKTRFEGFLENVVQTALAASFARAFEGVFSD
jgi:hypothetical protein